MNSIKDFFAFKEQPFKMTPITNNFFEYDSFNEATQTFIQYLSSDTPFLQIIGDNGCGKTSLIKKAISMLDNGYLYIQGGSVEDAESFQSLINFINQMLNERKKAIIFIDDAEDISIKTLEKLFATVENFSSRGTIKIIFAGDPEFKSLISTPKLATFAQRIFADIKLTNLSTAGVKRFINFQIKQSGSPSLGVSKQVVAKISKLSQGNMRIVNLLMEKAMIASYMDNSDMITTKHLNKALLTTNTTRKYLGKFLQRRTSTVYKFAFFILLAVFMIDIVFNHIMSSGVKGYVDNIFSSAKSEKLNEKKSAPFAKNLFVNDETVVVEAENNTAQNNATTLQKDNISSYDNATVIDVNSRYDKVATKNNDNITAKNSPTSAEVKAVTITARSLNIRSKPSTDADILGSVKLNDNVSLIKDDGTWIYIQHRNIKGYIMKTYTNYR